MVVNLPIETVASYFSSGDVRVVETGLQHGTITLCCTEDPIELTQTRVDLETDGRHAAVAYESDWSMTRHDEILPSMLFIWMQMVRSLIRWMGNQICRRVDYSLSVMPRNA